MGRVTPEAPSGASQPLRAPAAAGNHETKKKRLTKDGRELRVGACDVGDRHVRKRRHHQHAVEEACGDQQLCGDCGCSPAQRN